MILKILGALVAPFLIYELALSQTMLVKTATPAKALFDLKPLEKATPADLARGAKIYKANCVRCHNADPNIKGNLGPEQIDAPFEVVVSKIMTGKYPDPLPKGFVPKRKSKVMQPLKTLKNDIPYIYAWIQSVKKKKK